MVETFAMLANNPILQAASLPELELLARLFAIALVLSAAAAVIFLLETRT